MGKGRAIRKNDNGWNNRPTKETKFYTVRGKIRPNVPESPWIELSLAGWVMAIRQLARNCFSKMEWLVITRYIGSRRDLKVKYPRGRRKGFSFHHRFNQADRKRERGEGRERERDGGTPARSQDISWRDIYGSYVDRRLHPINADPASVNATALPNCLISSLN